MWHSNGVPELQATNLEIHGNQKGITRKDNICWWNDWWISGNNWPSGEDGQSDVDHRWGTNWLMSLMIVSSLIE